MLWVVEFEFSEKLVFIGSWNNLSFWEPFPMPSSWPDAAMQTLKSMENLFLRVLALHPWVSQNYWTSLKVIFRPKRIVWYICTHTITQASSSWAGGRCSSGPQPWNVVLNPCRRVANNGSNLGWSTTMGLTPPSRPVIYTTVDPKNSPQLRSS